jgi:hypothetical protein
MRTRRTRAFAAPFILTVVTALPGCPKGGGGSTTIDNNNKTPPDAAPATAEPVVYQEWSVSRSGDTCDAWVDVDCPPPDEATCNPPPPMTVACPGGLEEGVTMRIVQHEENGPCYLVDAECPEGGCDPQPAECPTWE